MRGAAYSLMGIQMMYRILLPHAQQYIQSKYHPYTYINAKDTVILIEAEQLGFLLFRSTYLTSFA